MKKLFSLFTAIVILFALAACTGSAQNGSSAASSASSLASSAASSSTQSSSRSPSSVPPFVYTPPLIESARDYFETLTYTDSTSGTPIDYMFHEPVRKSDAKRPLVIYMHHLSQDLSETNLDVCSNMVASLMKYESNSDEYSAYALFPITPTKAEGWWDYDQLEAFKKLFYHLTETYNIDTKRVYIVGLSMGGFTICQLLDEMPANTFAAAVPMSACSNLLDPKAHANTAFHIFHSTNDNTVNVACARSLNQQLLQSGHTKTTYTEFKNGDHSSPMRDVFSLQRDTFMPWLFAQRLP